MPHRAHTLLDEGHGDPRARKQLRLSWWGSFPDALRLHGPHQPHTLRSILISYRKCFRGDAEGPCWPGAPGFSPCLRGIALLGDGGGGGWYRAPTATRALSFSSGSRDDGGGGGSSSPDDKLTAACLARGSSVGDKLTAARAKRESAQGQGVGDPAAGGAARGLPGGWAGYGGSRRGGGSGGGGGRGGGGGGAGVKRKAPFAERASAESIQLNGELSRAGSVEEILTLVDERADVFNAVNVSTALNKLWSGLMIILLATSWDANSWIVPRPRHRLQMKSRDERSECV